MNSHVFVISRNHFQKMPMRVIMTYKMKKLISTILFTLLLPLFCFAQNAFHFSLAPRVSFTYGELNEILYGYNGEIVSQLDWNQKPLLNLGLEASASYKRLIVSALFDYSIPLGTSYMYDSDWDNTTKYSYTTHPLISLKNLNAELTFRYILQPASEIFFTPELQLKYMYSSFESDKGSGTRYDRQIKVYEVDYNRHSFFIFAGFSFGLNIFSRFLFNIGLFISPWTYHYCTDYHHGVKNPFSTVEIQHNIFSKIKIGFDTALIINNRIHLQLFTSILLGLPDRGDFYIDYKNSDFGYQTILSQKSGSSISTITSGTSIIFNF